MGSQREDRSEFYNTTYVHNRTKNQNKTEQSVNNSPSRHQYQLQLLHHRYPRHNRVTQLASHSPTDSPKPRNQEPTSAHTPRYKHTRITRSKTACGAERLKVATSSRKVWSEIW